MDAGFPGGGARGSITSVSPLELDGLAGELRPGSREGRNLAAAPPIELMVMIPARIASALFWTHRRSRGPKRQPPGGAALSPLKVWQRSRALKIRATDIDECKLREEYDGDHAFFCRLCLSCF